MNRRSLLEGIGTTGLLLAGTGIAAAADGDQDVETTQSECVVECCSDGHLCSCETCLCKDPTC